MDPPGSLAAGHFSAGQNQDEGAPGTGAYDEHVQAFAGLLGQAPPTLLNVKPNDVSKAAVLIMRFDHQASKREAISLVGHCGNVHSAIGLHHLGTADEDGSCQAS